MNATKTATAAAIDEAFDIPADAHDVERPWSMDDLKARVANFQLPSWTRAVVGFIAGVLTIGTVYYVGILVTSMLLTWVATMTTSAFIMFILSFMGLIISIIASLIAGAYVNKAVVERSYSAVTNRVANFFKRSATETVAA